MYFPELSWKTFLQAKSNFMKREDFKTLLRNPLSLSHDQNV
jgi:hypothetical protein